MKLAKVVEDSKNPQTLETLIQSLKALDIGYGDTILVHISLSHIGWIIGSVETLFKAILTLVGPLGTVVVPTQTMDNSDPKNWEHPAVPETWFNQIRDLMPAYDKKITPTRSMGEFVEYVRTYPGTERSNHPQVSFAAFGFHAKKIVKTHSLTPKFGLESPLGTLYHLRDAKILMIGTDMTTCTALHLAEALATKYQVKEICGCAMKVDNKRQWVVYEDKLYDSDKFSAIEQAYRKHHMIDSGLIGNAESKVFRFNDFIDFSVKLLNK